MSETQIIVDLQQMGAAARAASRTLSSMPTARKNEALDAIAGGIESAAEAILSANARDIDQARTKGLSEALVDRLLLTPERLQALADDTRKVISLPDPVGSDISGRVLENGLRLTKRRMPIGVIGVIYEARPNVTVDVAALALKTGNATILRGGSETLHSNMALVGAIEEALRSTGVPNGAVQYIGSTDRALVGELLRLDKFVDMIIPRGGSSLHRRCREEATIPVITGGIGICHVYADATADLDRAVDIIENAKVQRPSVCNALDTLLVHRAIADELIPAVLDRLAGRGVTFRLDPDALKIMGGLNGHTEVVQAAGPDDFDQEWLSLVLGIRVVGGLDDAIAHIHEHSTEHSDAILTRDQANASRFVAEITSAAVLVNASTRFNDGGQFGLGAEVAVSTQKLHARGPMGLEELTTYKWVVQGDGHIRV